MSDSEVRKSAEISADEQHRFSLVREWDDTVERVGFIMLNPSTADADLDDPTIRKCMGFARRWGAGGIFVANLFTFRATDPKELREHSVAALNRSDSDDKLRIAAMTCSKVVVGWGANGDRFPERVRRVYELLAEEISPDKIMHLGLTKSGQPKHPLFVRYETPPKVFVPDGLYDAPEEL